MSDFEQMPMEPEVPEKLFLQIIQDMEKFDLINSEFGGFSLTVKIIIGILVLILIAAIIFGTYSAYNNWDKIKKKAKKITTDLKGQVSGSKKKAT